MEKPNKHYIEDENGQIEITYLHCTELIRLLMLLEERPLLLNVLVKLVDILGDGHIVRHVSPEHHVADCLSVQCLLRQIVDSGPTDKPASRR